MVESGRISDAGTRDLAGVQRPRGGVECPEHVRRRDDRTHRLPQSTHRRDRSRVRGRDRREPVLIACNSRRHDSSDPVEACAYLGNANDDFN